MPRLLTLLLLLILSIFHVVQAQSDTTIVMRKMSHADSLDQNLNRKIDATQLKINNLLNPDFSKLFNKKKKQQKDTLNIDSLQAPLTHSDLLKADSLQRKKQKQDSIRQHRQQKVNQLKSLSTGKLNLSSPTDSLNVNAATEQLQQGQEKLNTLQNKVNQPADKIEGAVNDKLSLMNKEGGSGANLPSGASLPNANTTLPNAQLPDTSLPDLSRSTDLKLDNPIKDQLGEAGKLQEKIGDAKNLPQEQIGKLKSIDEIKGVQDKLGAANQLTDKAQAYQGDIKNVAQGNLNEVKELPKTLETQAGKVEELQGFQKETGQFGEYKQMADKAKDPEALKAESMKQATTKAIDHFAGKQEVLQAAMDKMSKLKSKYSSLNSMKDIPKRKPNEMKGKPLIERLVPGIAFQIQKSSDVLLDYNPLIGYRITGRFTAGAGWNERITIGKHVSISLDDRIYGPRVFADFKIGKGFSVRTDIEKMNTYVPALTASGYSTNEEYRAWVWSAFIGMKKEYQFVKNVKGTFQFIYNLYDDHNNSPYAERLNVRFGFDFPMKKRKISKQPMTE